MKLADVESQTSFYETFSDLIFATMAIFVLLMAIFIVQINLETGMEELRKQIEEHTAKRDEIVKKVASHKEELTQLEKAQQSMEKYNLEVVIAVDTTGSMQLELDQLTDTIAMIGKILPKIADTFKIGVVAYRRDKLDNPDMQLFKIRTIIDDDKDNGKSFRELQGFVRGLKAEAGSAPVEIAIDQAIKMFSSTDGFVGHQTLMLLGDVGPYEDHYQDQAIDTRNRKQENAIVNQLKLWVSKSLTRKTLILFSGDDEISKLNAISENTQMSKIELDQKTKFIESRKFFQRLATEIGQTEAFTSDSSKMMPKLLSTVLD